MRHRQETGTSANFQLPLDAEAVAKLLTELGRRVALTGGTYFQSRAYLRAAETLAALGEPLDRVVAEGRLCKLRGVGDAIARIITQLHHTGTHPLLDKLGAEIPPGVLEMLAIPGLRPEKVDILYRQLGITDIEGLAAAARGGELKSVKGLGAALQRKILQGIEIRDTARGARHIHRAAELITEASATLDRAQPGLARIVPAGDLRRGSELVADLAVVAEVEIAAGGPRVTKTGDLSVYVTDERHFGAALLQATGSSAHLAALRERATAAGMSLDLKGLHRGCKLVASATETAIYEALGLSFIEPELREGLDEIARAAEGRLPQLVTAEDMRGVLHAHTTASDGVDTLEAMAEASRAQGYGYIAITDHSKTAHYAGGLSVAEIGAQHAEIDRLNRSLKGFRIFKGIESDILPNGSLDYPDDVLQRFDFIIGSIHGQFRLDRQAQTERLVRAAENPFVTVIGHMTGRQLLRRPGYELDIERVLAACAAHGVAIEVNGNPWRLDLDWRWLRRGVELGCLFSVNPDAHSTREIASSTHWGLKIARKAGLEPERVINTRSASAFAAWLAQRKPKHQKMHNRPHTATG